MILIADSGSSKTDWRVIHKNGEVSQYRGVGFNPYYMTAEEMRELRGALCKGSKSFHEQTHQTFPSETQPQIDPQ